MDHAHQTSLLRAEIVSLHRFFVRWFGGTVPVSSVEAVMERFRSDFVYVLPGGRCLDRVALGRMFASSHGANPDFRIQVTGFAFQPLLSTAEASLWGVTYEEYQAGARNSAPRNGRISSAVFEIRDGAVFWVRLHECWLPPEEVAEHHDSFGSLIQHGLPPSPESLPAIRAALAAEVALEASGQDTIRMGALCAQLFCAGELEDVLRIWRAKQASFDAACSIDAELLCGAGLSETLDYLRGCADPEATAALVYLQQDPAGLKQALVGYRDDLLTRSW